MLHSPLQPGELVVRFVPEDSLHLHEETDPERVRRIRTALDDAGVLRNPPVAGGTTILDGATRSTALRQMGARHLLVQMVPYGGSHSVVLESWFHVLPATVAQSLLDALEVGSIPGVSVETTSLEHAQRELHNFQAGVIGRACAAVVASESVVYLVRIATDAVSTPCVLRNIVQHYGKSGEIHRIVNDDLVATVRAAEHDSMIVMFPSFTPEHITQSATNKDLLPAGITRHVIPGRALNINVSLHVLLSSQTTEEKNAWLEGVIRSKILGRKVRFYHESVFVFDD